MQHWLMKQATRQMQLQKRQTRLLLMLTRQL
nr:MAG TPA: hypothetical protein [Caudoviricetes sp.]